MNIAIRVENLSALMAVREVWKRTEAYHVGNIIDTGDPTSLLAGVACLAENVVRI